MSLFGIVIPEAAENLVKNPSAEVNANKYAGYGGGAGLLSIATYSRFGRKCLEVTPNSGVGDGVSIGDTSGDLIPAEASKPYNVTFWLYNPNLVPLLFEVFDQDDNSLATAVAWDGLTTIWQEFELQVSTGAGDSGLYVAIYKDSDATTNKWYMDGCQVVQSSEKQTYIDGDQPNCYWTGVKHDSSSKRLDIGPGGAEYDFVDDLGIYIENWSGFGLPPITVHTQGLGFLPGGFFENTKIEMRSLMMMLFAQGSSLENLHTIKQQLVDAVKPDRGSKETQFQIIYKGHTSAEKTVRTNVFYETGMEGSRVRGFYEHFGVRFLGVDPWWYEDDQKKHILDFTDALDFPYVSRRYDGVWYWAGSGCNGGMPLGFIEGPDGMIYAYGKFSSVDGVSQTSRICNLIEGVAVKMANNTPQGDITCAAISPNGDLYVGGSFSDIEFSTVYNHVAMYDGSWNMLGSGPGLDDDPDDVAIDLDGNAVYVGQFTDEHGGGGGNYNRVAIWNGSAWSTLSTGLGARCRAVAIHPVTGDYYFGGDFTTAGGADFNYVVKWSLENAAFEKVDWGGGMNGAVYGLTFAPDGTLYAIGAFTTASGNTVNKVAGWRGGNWFALGDGITGGTPSQFGMVGDQLWVGGMTEVDGVSVPYLAFWNGAAWIHPDISDFGAQTTFGRILGDSQETIYIGGSVDDATGETAGTTTVTNDGSATARPVITFVGPGRLVWISNYTTGDEMFFDLEALEDEVITIDTRVGSRGITSNWRSGSLLPRESSDFGNFRLVPGDNEIVALIRDSDSNTELDLYFTPVHWSVEGAADD